MSFSSRPIVAALGAVLLAASVSACGGDAAGADGDALSEASFIFDGKLTVCSDIPYEPFEFKKENGDETGFDVELVGQIAKKLDVELDMVDVAFDDITSGAVLNDEVCDVAVSAMTITGERARAVDFSSPYFNASQVLVTGKGSGISASIDSIDGKRVGVQADTTGETYLRDFAPAGTEIVSYHSRDLKSALLNGAVQAIVVDNTVMGPILAQNRGLRVAMEFETGEQYGMAVRKDGNVPLLRTIDDALAELRADGTYDKIYNKYF
jgi:polar amino acid transport system substrate-binding protein